MHIKEILVSGLFNKYDHKISLGNPENLVLLHGLNGVGKTTILKMIDLFYNGEYFVLMMYHFQKFVINYIDCKITIYSRYYYFAHDSIQNPAYIPFLFTRDIYQKVAIFAIEKGNKSLEVFYYAGDGFHIIPLQKKRGCLLFLKLKNLLKKTF